KYKLRTRAIDVPPSSRTKDRKQLNKTKGKITNNQPADSLVPNPHQVTMEDVTHTHSSIDQPLPPSSPRKDLNSIPRHLPKIEIPLTVIHRDTDIPKENIESMPEKDKFTTVNTKNSLEKPFSLEAEIGKLEISIPLLE